MFQTYKVETINNFLPSLKNNFDAYCESSAIVDVMKIFTKYW